MQGRTYPIKAIIIIKIKIINPTIQTNIWESNKIIKAIHLKIWTYKRKYNKEVKQIWILLITNPKSKSHIKRTKYQFVHRKQLKNSHAKQTPHTICNAIKNPKLKPIP